jgi:PAS domain S-box-containing protein
MTALELESRVGAAGDPEAALLDALPMGVYVCAKDGTIERFNREAARLWGRRPKLRETDERFCGAYRLYWPDGRVLPHAETPMAAALATGEPATNAEVWIERPDGSRVLVLVNIVPRRDAHGEVIGAVNCFHEITEMRRTEEALRESRVFLRAVVDNSPECVKVVARDGAIVQMNLAGCAMVQAAGPQEVEGRSVFDIVAPEDRQAWRENHDRVCGGETLSWAFDIVGLNGARRHLETHAAPIRVDGEVMHVAITRDVTDLTEQRRRLEASERRARDLLEALPTAVYTTDVDGRITFFNEAAVQLWGRRPELGELWCGSWRIFTPQGELLPHEACPMAVALREQRPVRNVEAVAERPDGSRVPFMPYPTPLRDADGKMTGAVNMLVDISFHKQADEQQQALINELNHRVKNSLATVQSIAQQTLRYADSAEAFRDAFTSRLIALSRAHDLLTTGAWTGADLETILEAVVSPYATPRSRIELSGPTVTLPPRQALGLAMALHELTTNAAKHGSLSTAAGRVVIAWRLEPDGVSLDWREADGPEVSIPTRRGFGSKMLERTICGELSGRCDVAFEATGLRCHLSIPVTPAA